MLWCFVQANTEASDKQKKKIQLKKKEMQRKHKRDRQWCKEKKGGDDEDEKNAREVDGDRTGVYRSRSH